MLYKEDLDKVTCATPGCDHSSHDSGMFFHGKCHPQSPAWVEYRDGLIHVTCAICGKGFGPPVVVATKSSIVMEHLHGSR